MRDETADRAQAVREARLALGLSVEALARALRLGASGERRLRRIELGQDEPTGPMVAALVLMLDRARRPALLDQAAEMRHLLGALLDCLEGEPADTPWTAVLPAELLLEARALVGEAAPGEL